MPGYVLVWFLFVFAWITNYLIRMGFAALLPPIMADLGLSYTGAGVLASAFFVAYLVVQLPAGLLGDRFGRRRVLIGGLLAGALASVSTGFAVSFLTLLAARVFTGASQGCLFSNDRAIIVSVTPPEKIGVGQAVSFLGPGLGITLGLVLGGLLGEALPWRTVFFVFALPPIVAALLVHRFVPAPPPVNVSSLGVQFWRVLRQSDVWLLGLSAAAVMWVQYVIATWAPLLFMEAGVAELSRAGFYASLQGLAGVGGLLAGGWLTDRAHRSGVGRKAVLAGSLAALTAAAMALALVIQRGPSVPVLAGALLLVAFCAWGVWGPSFAVLGEVVTGAELSTAFGLYNSVCVVGAVISPGLTGWTRDLTGSFVAGAYLCAAVALAGALATLPIRPRAPVGA